METLSTGMLNIRLAQFFSEPRKPSRDDLARLKDGLDFIARSIAGVRYLEAGESDGLDEDSLTNARYARRSLRTRPSGAQPRTVLKSLGDSVSTVIEDPTRVLPSRERKRLEKFFSAVGEAMVAEGIDSDHEPDEWPNDSSVECML